MDDNWASKACLYGVLLPNEFLLIELILRKNLASKGWFLGLLFFY
jgi:hypothetical protein